MQCTLICNFMPYKFELRGHCQMTHAYILKQEPQPKCSYRKPYIVTHILTECKDFSYTQNAYYKSTSIKELFESTNSTQIINYVTKITFYPRYRSIDFPYNRKDYFSNANI